MLVITAQLIDINNVHPSLENTPSHILYDCEGILSYSLKFLRGKYFEVLPIPVQKQIFADKLIMVKLPAMPCISYEFEISQEKIFVALL